MDQHRRNPDRKEEQRFPQIAGRTHDWDMIAIERGRVD
jgi:hypothetical protein